MSPLSSAATAVRSRRLPAAANCVPTSGPCWPRSGGVPAASAAWVFAIDSWNGMNWTVVVAPGFRLSNAAASSLRSGWRAPLLNVSRLQKVIGPLTGSAAAGDPRPDRITQRPDPRASRRHPRDPPARTHAATATICS